MSSYREQIKELLLDEFGLDGCADNDPIFSSNRLDSLDVLRLIVALESKYSIKISPFSVTIDMFDSIASIAALIEGKTD